MDPSDFKKLGLALGFSNAQLNRFKEDNTGSTMLASYKMLCEWLKTVSNAEARDILSDKLRGVNLVQLADSVQKAHVGDHITSLTKEEVQRVITDIQTYYRIHHCQIQADPLNSELLIQFDRIFTNLTLMEEDKGTKNKTPLLYKDLLKTKVNGIYPKRLLVEGEGGVGKTTLCAKIAWDWIHKTGYNEFRLVLLVLLREAGNQTVGQIVKSYLPDDNPVTDKQLDKYFLSNQNDVLLVLDGLDEFAHDVESFHQIALITFNRLFMSGKVLITSRRWRSGEIRKNASLRKAYAFIAVEGFSAKNLSSYIEKFFHPDKTSSEDLDQFISSNDVIRENMAPYPIYTAMLCIMWKEFDGERRVAMSKLQTFSQLFSEMVNFLVDHCLSKLDISSNNVDGEMERKRKEILFHLTNIGCLALQGLRERRLVFTEGEFQNFPGSVDIGCKVGVLTKQTQIFSLRTRRQHSQYAAPSVQFPHKLFQEYLSGMYLASLYNSNRSEYDWLMKGIIGNAREYRELLYFTVAQQKEVGLDVISQLTERRQSWLVDFIVDVAYESQDKGVAKAVADHLSTSSSKTLEITEEMQAHTVSGHISIIQYRQVDNMVISRSCGRTASEDLAEFICSSPTPKSIKIQKDRDDSAPISMHDVFYSVLAGKTHDSKVG
ncbi:NACHT, LRR and PYD domains-containing protein 1 homolog [Lytechinus variegatus]|uniref:NACHT, LRR and PYD domains-containing protein 1 homolog n=1 Tax=Lytechinus variegatus TaxID=7654 RepID=UPI001BB158B5|nr:NACHT, LRR and PYD domains-containing protein 1 homolog [Lytechinus variegatus]